MDHDAVLSIARERNAQLVISTCIDQANLVACSVSEKLGLFAPYPSEIAQLVTNKVLKKERMIESGIETSRFKHGTSWADFDIPDLKYPLIAISDLVMEELRIAAERIAEVFQLNNQTIEPAVTLKKRGQRVGESLRSNDRIGSFSVKAKTEKEAALKISQALESLDIVDTEGNSVMRRDVY